MRRLPIFFLLDISESMVGERLRQMQAGLDDLVVALRQDPYALETAYLSVIAFAGKARTLCPLVELSRFSPPRLPVGSGTSLGLAMSHLMEQLDRQILPTTSQRKGDWKPIVFLITDGRPTDNLEAALVRWKQKYAARVSLVAVGVGACVPLDVLGRLTDDVFHLQNGSEKEFTAFIAWISQSISSQSRSVGLGTDRFLVPVAVDGVVRIDKAGLVQAQDEELVIISGKCSHTRLPYLIRYERPQAVEEILAGGWFDGRYALTGVYALDADYYNWSESGMGGTAMVHSQLLHGAPTCPHCGAADAFVGCSCGQVFCVADTAVATCPNCSKSGTVVVSESGFEVGRVRG